MIHLGLFFGGRSTEHEVSVITALQAPENLDKQKYNIIPIYVSKSGDFYTNKGFLDLENFKDLQGLLLSSTKIVLSRKENKGGFFTQGLFPRFIPIDIAFPLFHGSFGEDGCIQGLFEIYQLPYVGFPVNGASIGMDKILSKHLFKSLNLPIGKFTYFKRSEWLEDPKKIIQKIESELKYPLFIKPANIGSTIGINKANTKDELSFSIEVAAVYSDKIVVEEAFENVIEINCSALGYKEVKASVCEMPISSGELLSFEDKYKKGSTQGSKSAGMASLARVIPAPIDSKLIRQIQETTVKIFKELDGCGVARVDYFVDQKNNKFWVNEINTLPGSLSFYLWNKVGISFPKLLNLLIEYGLQRSEDRKKTQYTFESGLLSQMAEKGGLKR